MAIVYDYTLISDLTLEMTKDEEFYIKVIGSSANINWSFKILDSGATATIYTGLESDEFMALRLTALSDLLLEGIKVSGTATASITSNKLNETQASPNYIYIKNNSATALRFRFSLRAQK